VNLNIIDQSKYAKFKFFRKFLLFHNKMSTFLEPIYETNKELNIVENLSTEFDENNIKSFAFPEYRDPDKKDDMVSLLYIFY